MSRRIMLDRRHRRALAGGIVLSAAVHAALFASLRFEIPAFDSGSVVTLEAAVRPEPEAETPVVELLQFEPAPPVAAAPAAAGPTAPTPSGTAPEGPIVFSLAATAPAQISVVGAEPAFETLAVIDPLTQARVQPIAFDALPSAPPTEAEDDGVEVYVPGSVGKAKRQWARGVGEVEGGAGRIGRVGIVAIGGGHCPMPGRVPVSWGRVF